MPFGHHNWISTVHAQPVLPLAIDPSQNKEGSLVYHSHTNIILSLWESRAFETQCTKVR
jgi:hypothetical protein